MALSEAEKEIVKQKVKNRRREMLGAGLDESLSSNLNKTIQHDPNIVIESDILIENQTINNEFFRQEPEENNMRPKTNSNQESISTSWKYVLCTIILILAPVLVYSLVICWQVTNLIQLSVLGLEHLLHYHSLQRLIVGILPTVFRREKSCFSFVVDVLALDFVVRLRGGFQVRVFSFCFCTNRQKYIREFKRIPTLCFKY